MQRLWRWKQVWYCIAYTCFKEDVAPDRVYVKRSWGNHWFIAFPVNIDDHVQCYWPHVSLYWPHVTMSFRESFIRDTDPSPLIQNFVHRFVQTLAANSEFRASYADVVARKVSLELCFDPERFYGNTFALAVTELSPLGRCLMALHEFVWSLNEGDLPPAPASDALHVSLWFDD